MKSLNGYVQVTRCTPDTNEIDKATFVKTDVKIKLLANFFNYESDKNSDSRKVWLMNYADPKLFGFYANEFFARAIEEYYAIYTKNENWIKHLENWDYYVNIDDFNKVLFPIVDDYIKELKLTK